MPLFCNQLVISIFRFMDLRLSIILLLWFFPLTNAFAQIKFEQEQRVQPHTVPTAALTFIDQCPIQKGVKWYKENSQEGVSFEAKFKMDRYRYSVEFDPNGVLQDIEKTISFKSLPDEIQNSINQSIKDVFLKYKLQKTQIQFKGTNSSLLAHLQGKPAEISIAYEIVLKGRIKDTPHHYEILTDAQGQIIKQLQIQLRPADNLDF